jgi:nucleoside-diphosphate-sugar epimerase
MDKTRSVLVTGATGFVGRATVVSLEQAGWAVIRGVRSAARSSEDGEIYLDLKNPAAILALGNGVRFDAIVHLGAHIGWSGATETEMFAPNILATGCLAFLASQWNAHLLYASAAIVCGVKSERIDASTPVSPDTAYAQSKRLGEQLIEASHVPSCILRIGGVFGSNGPAHLGLNRAIDGALKGNPPLQSGSGAALRNYIYVKDVAEAIVFALQQRLEGIHFLSGSEVTSMNQMLQTICDTLLPGQQPAIAEGPDAMSQVIEPSKHLPKSRGFREALTDIKGTRQ